jgi:hypothetical protein
MPKADRDAIGRFLPGQTANPAGRPRGSVQAKLAEIIKDIGAELRKVEVQEGDKAAKQIAMTNLEIVVRRLYRDAQNGLVPASREIFDRGWGKAMQPFEVSGANGEGIKIIIADDPPKTDLGAIIKIVEDEAKK